MRQAMKWLLSQAEVKAPAKVLGYERAWHPENVKAGQWAMRRWCLRGRTPYSPREDASIPRAVGSTGVWRLQNWSLKDRVRMATERLEKGTVFPTNTGTKIRTGDRRKGWRGVVVIKCCSPEFTSPSRHRQDCTFLPFGARYGYETCFSQWNISKSE